MRAPRGETHRRTRPPAIYGSPAQTSSSSRSSRSDLERRLRERRVRAKPPSPERRTTPTTSSRYPQAAPAKHLPGGRRAQVQIPSRRHPVKRTTEDRRLSVALGGRSLCANNMSDKVAGGTLRRERPWR